MCLIIKQIPAKQGFASRFVVEANIKALMSKSNSRRSKKMMDHGGSIQPRREYQISFGWISIPGQSIRQSIKWLIYWNLKTGPKMSIIQITIWWWPLLKWCDQSQTCIFPIWTQKVWYSDESSIQVSSIQIPTILQECTIA